MLTNSGHGADDIGLHLINNVLPLAPAPEPRVEIEVARSVMQRYVGVYELAPTFKFTVTLGDAGLLVQATGQPTFEVFAESETLFFLKAVEAQIEFLVEEGEVVALILHQGGAAQRAAKVQ